MPTLDELKAQYGLKGASAPVKKDSAISDKLLNVRNQWTKKPEVKAEKPKIDTKNIVIPKYVDPKTLDPATQPKLSQLDPNQRVLKKLPAEEKLKRAVDFTSPSDIKERFQNLREGVGDVISEAGSVIPFVPQVAYSPESEQDLGKLKEDYDKSLLGQYNHKENLGRGGFTSGITGGIINPETEAPISIADKVVYGLSNVAGSAISIGKISSVFDKIAKGSVLVTNLMTQYPKVAKYAYPLATNIVGFDIYGQLDPEISDRFHKLGMDTLLSVPFTALGFVKSPLLSVPAAFGVGYGLAKADGASDEDAIIQGGILAVLDLYAKGKGKIGEHKMTKQEAETILKNEGIDLNKLPGTPSEPKDVMVLRENLNENVRWYQTHGGQSMGKETVDPALLRVNEILKTEQGKYFSQESVKKAIQYGQMKPDVNGDITVYRVGEPSKMNDLVSVTYDKAAADFFSQASKNAPIKEFKVKPEEISYFIGGAEKEVLLPRERVESGISAIPKEQKAVKVKTSEQKATKTQTEKKSLVQEQVEEISKFEKAPDLTPEARTQETKAFEKILRNEREILDAYKKENGKVVNTDDFRPFFKEEGYNGTNSATFQEPASYLAKRAFTEGLKNPGSDAVFTSGISGAGKSTALKNIPEYAAIAKDAAVILDSNLGSWDSAAKKLNEASAAGKKPVIFLVGREAVDAFENGVVKRSIENPKEMGRIVPTSEPAKNGPGSLAVAKKAQAQGIKVYFVDNANGKGKAKLTDAAKLEKKLNYPKNLKSVLDAKAKELYEKTTITKEQYEAYTGKKAPDNVKVSTEKGRETALQKPVQKATGKERESQAFEKYKKKFDELSPDIPEYKRVEMAQDRARAEVFVSENPVIAERVARGLETPPQGITQTNIVNTVIDKAIETGNSKLANELITKQTLRLTRAGQEISAQRGAYNPDDVYPIVQELLKQRRNSVLKINYQTEPSVTKQKYDKMIKETTKEAVKTINKETAKIKSAQDILNSLIC